MNGNGINQPMNSLTVLTSGHSTIVFQTAGLLPVQHEQWRLGHVIDPRYVTTSYMVHVLPGYAPIVPLYTLQASTLPQNNAYRPITPRWEPQVIATPPPPPVRSIPFPEPIQDSHYNYLRHVYHDRLDLLRIQDWQYVAHILKPEMEHCGLNLPNEKAAMDILLQLRQTQDINSFEQLELALLERVSNAKTQVEQSLNDDMLPEHTCDNTLAKESVPDDARSLHGSAVSESEGSEPLSEYSATRDRDREVTPDYASVSSMGSYHDPNLLPPSDLSAGVPYQNQFEPQQQLAGTGRQKRFSPKTLFGRLVRWCRHKISA